MTKRTIRVALLINDTPVPAVLEEDGTYYDIYKRWLLQSLSTYPDTVIAKTTELIIDGYDVVDKREYPPEDRLLANSKNGYDAIMLTGSKHTAHDPSNPFAPPLISFIRRLTSSAEYSHLKFIGICFGHQILSLALGGECASGQNGWEIGVYGCKLTEEGKKWWTWHGDEDEKKEDGGSGHEKDGKRVNGVIENGNGHVRVDGQGGEDKVYLEQMHRDHVPSVPPSCHLLLSTPQYPVHSFVRYHPLSSPSNPIAQILTVQGHPEFTPSIVSHIIDARSSTGVFSPEVTKEARRRAGGKGTGGEGFGRIGWSIWKVLLQNVPVQG
ncbi:cytoplasmic protein [Kwoniella mangroviensis CBS 10435]|uniref:Cytoplasmic protein n=1 Tax=Kwoniella mangroviensis CBS 10435 TaxID=1331196 RepID=A0A1B9IKK4_9TREE|nr:cytoplasmic protein [Kwoniella mangroviensis CBS 10435]